MLFSPKLLHPLPMGGSLDGSSFACLDSSGDGDGQEEEGSPGILDILHRCPHQCPCIMVGIMDGRSQLADAPPWV